MRLIAERASHKPLIIRSNVYASGVKTLNKEKSDGITAGCLGRLDGCKQRGAVGRSLGVKN